MRKVILTVFAIICLVAANAQVVNKTTTTKTTTEKSTNIQSSNSIPENRTETEPAINNTGTTTITNSTTETQQQPVKKKLVKVSPEKLNAVSSAPLEKKSTGTKTNSDTEKKPD